MKKYVLHITLFTLSPINALEDTFIQQKLHKKQQQIQYTSWSKKKEIKDNINKIEEQIKRGEKVNMPYANLEGANLSGFDLTGANLKGANLQKAKLYNTILQAANLQQANLTSVQAYGTSFANANLKKSNFEYAKLSPKPRYRWLEYIWPSPKYRPTDFSGAQATQANFNSANANAVLFPDTDLSQAQFKRTKLIDALFKNANASNANFLYAKVSPATNFYHTNFTKAILTGSNISRSMLMQQNAITTGADTRLTNP